MYQKKRTSRHRNDSMIDRMRKSTAKAIAWLTLATVVAIS
jgi:hypothetical protein